MIVVGAWKVVRRTVSSCDYTLMITGAYVRGKKAVGHGE